MIMIWDLPCLKIAAFKLPKQGQFWKTDELLRPNNG